MTPPDLASERSAQPAPVTLSRRNLLIGGVLLSASGIAYARQPEVRAPRVDPKVFESWVPKQFGRWTTVEASSVVLPPPDALRDRLYDSLVTRTYTSPGQPSTMLLLAYNNRQDGMLQVHRPEVCYPVGGFRLSETRPFRIDVPGLAIPANFFTATGPDRVEQVGYFTRLGDAFPRTWAEQRLAVVRANIAGAIPDGMMMRVSLLGTDAGAAAAELESFASALIGASPPPLRRLLIGNG
ncbi:EpsI family protein [Erythrobacteraceae bacterium CFH 75059]|uniref:exosortase-associated protein EpsI, V-type n=1 Tax=Qipengyuania thermophila TaxID=2509361 RepID=UPI0010227FE4|nr:exosortase-associated protein EpsI, V-type [Qipengyuania thermophila]TCD04861.1 EpsI family protein [Erythrobacteraceae bacterium CFH 75059]